MRLSALVMAMLLVATPALPQSSSPPETTTDGAQTSGNATWVEVPEELQRAFGLMKQPGFHPELLELLKIEVSTARTLGAPPAPAVQTWEWIWIGILIGTAVLVIFFSVCAAQGSGISCSS